MRLNGKPDASNQPLAFCVTIQNGLLVAMGHRHTTHFLGCSIRASIRVAFQFVELAHRKC